MNKTFGELLDYIAERLEYLEADLADVDVADEPNTYWYVYSAIEVYKSLAKKIEDEDL